MNVPDDTMSDVRIVHDRVGSYADWIIVDGMLPYGNRRHDYLLGKLKPNYPVPSLIGPVRTTRYACYFINPDWIGTTLTINWCGEWHWK